MSATTPFEETDEQRMLREAVRSLAERYGHAYYLEQSRGGGGATELWRDLGRNGYLAANIPSQYGGAGAGITELAIVCEELACAGTPSFMLIVSSAICAELLASHGSDALKDAWLPRLAAGEAAMAFGITEPDAGLNTHRLATTATRDGEHYRLRGQKHYVSGVEHADAVVIVARSGTDEGSGRARLSMLLVDPALPGFEKALIPVEMTAPEKQWRLFLDDVMVPAECLIGVEDEGMRQMFSGLNPERIMAAALENGIARYALEKASRYARERDVWGVPIGTHQGIAHPLAKCKIEVELARLMTAKAAWLHDHGRDAAEASNMAKYAAAEACLAALDQAIQVHGGNGLSTDFGLATLWGAARLQRTAPVSREMIFNYVAQHSLELPRSY